MLKSDPTAVTSASFVSVLGIIVGQVIGVGFTTALPYVLLSAILGGCFFGLLSYTLNKNHDNKADVFFRKLAVSLASLLGGLLYATTIAPFLLASLTLIPPSIFFVISIVIAGLSFGLVALILEKIGNRISKYFNPSFERSPWSFMLWSNAFIFMILGGSLGINFGPAGSFLGIIAGAIFGGITGLFYNYFSKQPVVSKVLSNLFAIFGSLTGVMLGIIIKSILPIPVLFLSVTVGSIFMIVGFYIGKIEGNKITNSLLQNHEEEQSYFDLNNPKLRHKLYQGSLSVPMLALGYFAGSLLGYPAAGAVVASSMYIALITIFYVINRFTPSVFKPVVKRQTSTPKSTVPVVEPRPNEPGLPYSLFAFSSDSLIITDVTEWYNSRLERHSRFVVENGGEDRDLLSNSQRLLLTLK